MVEFEVDGATLECSVVKNDRGEWKSSDQDWYWTFTGFGGENVLTIIPMLMQSGDWDVVVVHSVVDSPSRVGQSSGRVLSGAINEAVRQVCDYPEEV